MRGFSERALFRVPLGFRSFFVFCFVFVGCLVVRMYREWRVQNTQFAEEGRSAETSNKTEL